MIRALLGAAGRMRFRTYDIDATSGAVLTCDGSTMKVRIYADAEEFLTESLRGRHPVYFCHGGGRDQVQPILFVGLDNELPATASFFGSVATRTQIKTKDESHSVQLMDSTGLLRGDLPELCEWAGIKLRAESAASRVTATAKLLNRMQDILAEIGGAMRPTLASVAYDLFRRVYLTENFDTDSNLNRRAKRALYAGRTEPHRRKILSRERNGAAVVDINSAYGAAMLRGPIPGALVGVSKRRGPCSISRVRIEVPTTAFASVPFRSGSGSIYYPTGVWDGWYHESVIAWAEAHGAIVREVYESLHFSEWKAPGEFAEAMYERRAASSCQFERKIMKGLIQSLSGRLAMRGGRERLLCFPKERKCPHDGEHDSPFGPLCFRPIRAGVYIVTDPDRASKSSHVAATAGINAVALTMLNEGAAAALRGGAKIGYLGTDALHVDSPHSIPVGEGLGEFRIERRFSEGEYVSALWYRTDESVTAAGLPEASLGDWQALMSGVDVVQPYASSLRESISADRIFQAWRSWHVRRICSTCYAETPGETCRLHPWAASFAAENRPRRRFLADGSTEPWDVDVVKSSWIEHSTSGTRKIG